MSTGLRAPRVIDPGADPPEIPLTGGDVTEGVVRVGATVRRPRGAHSLAVAAYLRHLEGVGFEGAPRWLGIDRQGRDILDFLEGLVPSAPPESWAVDDAALTAVGRMLRRLHDASSEYVAPPRAAWFGDDLPIELPPAASPLLAATELVSHSDVTPQNVVFRQGAPWGLIDFDLSRPTTRLVDVFNTAMHWVPLADPGDLEAVHVDRDPALRLRRFVDAYGLPIEARERLVEVGVAVSLRSWYRMRANAEHRGGGWERMWREGVGDRILRRRHWLCERGDRLTDALLDGFARG